MTSSFLLRTRSRQSSTPFPIVTLVPSFRASGSRFASTPITNFRSAERSELQRDRWFRMHETPGVVDSSFERWAIRATTFCQVGVHSSSIPRLTRGWKKGAETLKEREDKPGAADLTFFDRYDSGERQRKSDSRRGRTSPLRCVSMTGPNSCRFPWWVAGRREWNTLTMLRNLRPPTSPIRFGTADRPRLGGK